MHSVKSRSFNPYEYSSDYSEEHIETSTDSVDYKEITKNKKKSFKVDMGHFDNLCKKFRNKVNSRIKNLHGKNKEEFNLMVSYIHLLYGTKYYKNLHDRVKKYFGDIDKVKPGTVGGYFGGCFISTSFNDQPGCSLPCAGSIPLPKDEEGWSFCNKAVIFAEYNKKGYNFSVLKQSEENSSQDSCYVFVEHTNLHDFKGFSLGEKEELKKLGAENIHLIGCNGEGTKYVDLYGDSCDIKEIKYRKKAKTTDNLGLILIVIFLLFIVMFFGWKFWNMEDGGVNL